MYCDVEAPHLTGVGHSFRKVAGIPVSGFDVGPS